MTQLSAGNISIFSFPDDNFSKYQLIFTKFDMCVDIVEIWFEIANGQILSVFDRVICSRYDNGGVLSFHVFLNWIQHGCLANMVYAFGPSNSEYYIEVAVYIMEK